MATISSTALGGGAAGALATVSMSAVMLGAEQLGFMDRHPPEAIARKALRTVNQVPSRSAITAAAITGHFAFGTAAGAAYALIDRRNASVPERVTKGAAFGLALYGASYAGWLPAMNILPNPTEDRPGRQVTMALAHLVYGISLALLLPRSRSTPAESD